MKIDRIRMDIDKKLAGVIPSVQWDSNTRFLHINILNGAKAFDLTGCSVKIAGLKPDGTSFFNSVKIINAKEGFIEVVLTEQMNAAAGTVRCDIKIYNSEGVLTTQPFIIDVEPSVTTKAITSANEFGTLTEALDMINNIDAKFESLTADTVAKATEKEIQKQIASGHMANLALADGSVEGKKLKDGTITSSKFQGKLRDDIRGIQTFMNAYSGNAKPPTPQVFGTYVTKPNYANNRLTFTPNGQGTENSAIYFECNELEITLSNIAANTFIALHVDSTYVYSISLAMKQTRKHALTGGSLENIALTVDGSFLAGIPIQFKNDGESIQIYQSNRLKCTIPKTTFPGWFSEGVSRMGFLVTKAASATLDAVTSVDCQVKGVFNVATRKDLDALQEEIEPLREVKVQVNSMYQDLYGEATRTHRMLTLADYEKHDCISHVGKQGEITIKDVLLTEKYDWFYTKPYVLEYEVTHTGCDTWIVVKHDKDSVIAFATSASNNGAVRRFYTDRPEIWGSATKEFNAELVPVAGDKMRVYEVESNIFHCDVYKDSIGEYKRFMKIDINSITNISAYTLGYGMLTYSGVVGKMVFKSAEGLVESYAGTLSKIPPLVENVKDLKDEVKQLKENIAQGGGTEAGTNKIVDLVMFMGQSNMAGRGVAAESPVVPIGHGYEFRAISDPNRLHNIVEPFGVKENNPSSGVNESSKTGSMVSSFVKAYYESTKTPIVAVSCAKGGTRLNWWQPGGGPLNDAINRHNLAKTWLENNGYIIRNDFMVWCQGCSDGDVNLPAATYQEQFKKMVEEMMKHGIQKCFMVRIGNHRDNPTQYDDIISAQTELGKTYKNVVLVSTKFASMASDGLMKDSFHYKQEGYNIVGRDAGINTAFYIKNLKEPTMWDWEYKNLYYSHKN